MAVKIGKRTGWRRAGTRFPVRRTHMSLACGNYKRKRVFRVTAFAAVYLAAVLQCIAYDFIAAAKAERDKRQRLLEAKRRLFGV